MLEKNRLPRLAAAAVAAFGNIKNQVHCFEFIAVAHQPKGIAQSNHLIAEQVQRFFKRMQCCRRIKLRLPLIRGVRLEIIGLAYIHSAENYTLWEAFYRPESCHQKDVCQDECGAGRLEGRAATVSLSIKVSDERGPEASESKPRWGLPSDPAEHSSWHRAHLGEGLQVVAGLDILGGLSCGGGGIGRHAGLRSPCRKAWGFNSPPPH